MKMSWTLAVIMAATCSLFKVFTGLMVDVPWWAIATFSLLFPGLQAFAWALEYNAQAAIAEHATRRRRELAKWRGILQSGRCPKCQGRVYVAHRASAAGTDLVMCENQYGAKHVHIVGTGRCVGTIADIGLLNAAAAQLEEPLLVVF